ncbi:CIS tube protein [Natrialbaceae archaeon AArc-T1-2]|uniref:CIS tube protein n=1 Tax=Natrialbaceae archaeon AArc-T1-2 TaxID=3053904 RepID=UPI00255AE4A3|nr:phage tail protein [Natrialbaceae archaeon AArc-T1-2]WIV66069.1 phage tail protein [Natrialbaceae archaeon AArc-T1-2]
MSSAPTSSDLQKAHIQVLDEDGESKEEIPVLFNPSEYSTSKSITYEDQKIAGTTTPATQFSDGDAETLSMTLFFDTYERSEDVQNHTDQLDQLLELDSERHAPPVCRFVWGEFMFKAVVESLDKQFTMFLPEGTPVRASVDVQFREYRPPREQRKEKPLHSTDKTTTWRVIEGDTLPRIAAKEYNDAGKWRPIAERNDIETPRDLDPGTVLVIPPL